MYRKSAESMKPSFFCLENISEFRQMEKQMSNRFQKCSFGDKILVQRKTGELLLKSPLNFKQGVQCCEALLEMYLHDNEFDLNNFVLQILLKEM